MKSGVIILNKPKGMTSSDCVVKLRKILKESKIGHTGTLDPNVTGVLPICVGKATKLVNYLTAQEKVYEAEVILGIETDTEDMTGNITKKMEINNIDLDFLDKIISSFKGEYMQTPPMYSAIKYHGKKLYEYARENITIERKERQIKIYDIKRISNIEVFDNQIHFKIIVKGQKGLYVRTLAKDIGRKLNIPSTMGELIRLKNGIFGIDDAYTFEEIELGNYKMFDLETLFKGYESIYVSNYLEKMVKNGIMLDKRQIDTKDYFKVYNEKKELIAIYYYNKENDYRPLIII